MKMPSNNGGCLSHQSPPCGSCIQESLSPRQQRGRRRVSSRSDEQQALQLKLTLINTCPHHKLHHPKLNKDAKRIETDKDECVHRHTDPAIHGQVASSNNGFTLYRLPSFSHQVQRVLRKQSGVGTATHLQAGSFLHQQQLSEEEKTKTIDDYMIEGERQVPMLGGVSLDQFKIIGDRIIGRGTYGEVKLVEREGKRYAMKLLDKEQITRVSIRIQDSSVSKL